MRIGIMVTDVLVRFRLAAIEHTSGKPRTWNLEVMTIEQVAEILVSLGFLDPAAASRLTEASTTITPQPGLKTMSFADMLPIIDLVYPNKRTPASDIDQTYILFAQGDTTEEKLEEAGFVFCDSPPQ